MTFWKWIYAKLFRDFVCEDIATYILSEKVSKKVDDEIWAVISGRKKGELI